jgi:hypothetical protein
VSRPGCAYGQHGVNREITMRGPVAMNRGGIAVADVDGPASPDHSNGRAILPVKLTRIAGAPRMSSAARLVVVSVAFVCCAVWAARAAATSSYRSAGVAPASQVVLGSSFRPIRAGVEKMFPSGDYLLSTIPNSFYPHGLAPVVINDRLGTTTALDPSCDADALGPPWVLMSCPQSSDPYGPYDVELYSLADGTRKTVTLSPGMPYCSSPPYDSQVLCSAEAVGAHWIEWVAGSYHHLPTEVYFQNIQTGELRGDPTNATTFADLNSSGLAHTTCPGVRLMPNNLDSVYDGGTAWGSLTPYGQFALAVADNGAFLERCGTNMRRLLTSGSTDYSSALASNAGAIVWQAVPNHLSGLFLPSLQTFTIPLPSAIVKRPGSSEDTPVSALGLTSGALYVGDGWAGTVWRTASPTELPLNRSRPELTRSGNTLTCRRGSWRNAVAFSYAWRVNGVAKKDAKPTRAVSKARQRRSVSCSVTASNAAGKTTAASSQLHVR